MVVAELVVKYLADIADIKTKLGDIDKAEKQIAEKTKQMGTEVEGLHKSVNNVSQGFGYFAQVIGTIGLVSFIKNVVMAAGRADELQRVMYIVGKNSGYTKKELDGAEDSVRKLGIQTDLARSAITRTIQANLDLAKAVTLARMAQDLAVISGWNSSETLDRLIINIQQADTLGLRFMGIILNQDEAMRKYATTMKITGRELTRVERTQAIYNEVMAQGAKFAGAYEESLNSWTKTARTTERFAFELKKALGEGLQEPLLYMERSLQNIMTFMAALGHEANTTIGYMMGFAAIFVSLTTAVNLLSILPKYFAGIDKALVKVHLSAAKLFGIFYLIGGTQLGRDIVSGLAQALESAAKYAGDLLGGLVDTKGIAAGVGDSIETFIVLKLMKVKTTWALIAGVIAGAYAMLAQFGEEQKKQADERYKDEFKMPATSELAKEEVTSINERIKATERLVQILKWGGSEQEKQNLLAQLDIQLSGKKILLYDQNIDLVRAHTKSLEDRRHEIEKNTKAMRIQEDADAKAVNYEKELMEVGVELRRSWSAIELLPSKLAKTKAFEDLIKSLEAAKLLAEKSGSSMVEGYAWAVRETKNLLNQLPAEMEKIDKEMQKDYEKTVVKQIIENNTKIIEQMNKMKETKMFDPAQEAQLIGYLNQRKKLLEGLVDLYTKDIKTASNILLEELFKKHDESLKLSQQVLSRYNTELDKTFDLFKNTEDVFVKWSSFSKMKDIIASVGEEYQLQAKSIQASLQSTNLIVDNLFEIGRKKIDQISNEQIKSAKNAITNQEQLKNRLSAIEEERVRAMSALEGRLTDFKEAHYKKVYENYKNMLEAMSNQHYQNIERIKALELDRVKAIADAENKILDIRRSAEAEIRDLERQLMTPKEARQNIVGELGDLMRSAQQEMGKGTEAGFGRATNMLNEAKSLAKSLASEVKGEKGETIIGKTDALKEAIGYLKDIESLQVQVVNEQKDVNTSKITEEISNLKTYNAELETNMETVSKTITDLESRIARLTQIKIEVTADTSQINSALDEIEARIQRMSGMNLATLTGGLPKSLGGIVHAQVGRFLAGYGGGDRIHVNAEAGEYVLRKESVKHYGLGFIDALNRIAIPKLTSALSTQGTHTEDKRNYDNRRYHLNFSEKSSVNPNMRNLLNQLSIEFDREKRRVV